jgi:hypothetical protein
VNGPSVRAIDEAELRRRLAEGPGTCENCGRRPATVKWCGEAGVLAFTHGFAKNWCEACALAEQVRYAEKLATDLPELRRRLAEAEAK